MTTLSVVDRDGVRVLRLHGELDLMTAPEVGVALFAAAAAAAAAAGAVAVGLDLAGVPFCDSSGVRLVDELLHPDLESALPALRPVTRPAAPRPSRPGP